MSHRMLIEYVSPESVGYFVLARQLEVKDFALTNRSRLGGVPIQPVLSQPRKLRKDGTLDLEVFAFRLTNVSDLKTFSVGTEVLLVEDDREISVG